MREITEIFKCIKWILSDCWRFSGFSVTKIAFQVSTRAEALATPGLLPDGVILLEIAPKVLPMGRLPKAVVSTMNWSATGSYVFLTG